MAVSGKGYYDTKNTMQWLKNLDFDMVIANQMDTPFYRMMIEERLSQLLINQIIDPIMYFENSTLPFSDSLLNQLKAKQKEMQQKPRISKLSTRTFTANASTSRSESIYTRNPKCYE